MQQGPVIFRRLFPSGQGPAKPVHPAVRPPDCPATGPEARGFAGISFLFTGRDIRLVTTAQPVCFARALRRLCPGRVRVFAPGIPSEEHRVCPPPV
ncbi:hypothetical protein AV903_18200 [Erwinia tracheiphila]|uniref:Uncharacterized protein n=1 Tax=Erwinia tracheiphila TaxID=65700 RepID=A0A345CVR8_9GAMM|nr:hypothetical protein AV903_18200 [Erwinia tracheiphila]